MPVYKRTLPSGKISIFVKGQIDKVPYWETVRGATTKAEGKKREREIIREIEAKQIRKQGQRILLADYIKHHFLPARKSKASYNREIEACKAINIFFTGRYVDEIKVSHARAFQYWLLETETKHKRTRKRSTINREMSVLSAIFTLASDDELIAVNPCHKVRGFTPEPHRNLYLTDDEITRLLEQCTGQREHLKDIIETGLNTGLRPGKVELYGLQVSHLDFALNEICLVKHKTVTRTGKARIIPINSKLRGLLLRLCEDKQPDDYVFINPLTGAPYSEIKKGFKRACELAKIQKDKRFPYILRHTFATRLAQAGVDITEIQYLLGHTKIEMTMRYVHPSAKKAAEAVERIIF